MSKFTLVLGRQIMRHTAVFRELVESMQWGLTELGHDVDTSVEPRSRPDSRDIILAPHLLLMGSRGVPPFLNPGTIVYNAEPFCSPNFVQSLVLLGRRDVIVWDYWERTTEFLLALGIPAITVPFAWCPSFDRRHGSPTPERDVDVLFVGSMSARRQRVLDELGTYPVRTAVLFGVYGQERDAMLARAKVCLNVHYWPEGGCEDLRILLAAANGAAVVSEGLPDAEHKRDWAVWSAYASLATRCVELAINGEWQHQATIGQWAVRKHDAVKVLRTAIERSVS